jgi:ubiquinone/menaquinone biosynthesis C-methylase UbiE
MLIEKNKIIDRSAGESDLYHKNGHVQVNGTDADEPLLGIRGAKEIDELIERRETTLDSVARLTAKDENLKPKVRDFWNRQSCDTEFAAAPKFSREYFEEIEMRRYNDQACIHAFAQFTRYYGKRVLEVGFGAGTDFIQWLRAGAMVSGVDLTQEALDNLTHRIGVYELPQPENILVGDAENLPFESDSFDLGYSFGVLHHTPDTGKALKELVRVIRPGGEIKIMLYNLHSICSFKFWVKYALLRGKPWKSPRWALWNHMESIGTKGYTRTDLRRMFSELPLENIRVRTEINGADYLAFSAAKPINLFCRALLRLGGYNQGWHLEDYRKGAMSPSARKSKKGIEFSGNRLGLFHCICATKSEG